MHLPVRSGCSLGRQVTLCLLRLKPHVNQTWTVHLLQVVQSRTCGSAAKQGGVGVRMLVPLVDMLNHGGDEKASTSHGHIASDSVR